MKRATFRNLGILFMVVGSLLVVYGLIGSVEIHCPAGGCSPSDLQAFSAPFAVSFYLGVSFIALGIVFLIASRYAKGNN